MYLKKDGFCDYCDHFRPFRISKKDIIINIFFSFITLGLWFFIWIFLFRNSSWHCSSCGRAADKESFKVNNNYDDYY